MTNYLNMILASSGSSQAKGIVMIAASIVIGLLFQMKKKKDE